jgi:hypothetical protein
VIARTAHLDTFARDNLPPRSRWPELLFAPPRTETGKLQRFKLRTPT